MARASLWWSRRRARSGYSPRKARIDAQVFGAMWPFALPAYFLLVLPADALADRLAMDAHALRAPADEDEEGPGQ